MSTANLQTEFGSQVGADTLSALRRIDAYDMSYLYERWVEKTHGLIKAEDCELAAHELKRFCALPLLFPGVMVFPPTRIDAVWHEFILFTQQYQEFCNDVLGFELGHNPRPPIHPDHKGPRGTIELYEQAWGPAPAYMWGPVTKGEERWLLYQHAFPELVTKPTWRIRVAQWLQHRFAEPHP